VPFTSTDDDGVVSTRYYIQMPDGVSHKVTFEVKDLVATTYSPKQLKWEDLAV